METDEKLIVLAYNMRVIRAFWKVFKGQYGINYVRGNETDRNSLYATIERSRETIRKIEYMELTTNTNIIQKWADRIDLKTGISHEYLSGKEHIKLGKRFQEKYFDKYYDYIEECDRLRDILKQRETDMSGYPLAKIEKIAKGNEYTPAEKEEFKKEINIAKKAVQVRKEFEDALFEEVKRIKNLDMAIVMEIDKKLYRLIFFLKTGKQTEAIGLITMEDILRVMERTGMEYLNKYKKEELARYIKALERHLTFAKAVQIIATENKKI